MKKLILCHILCFIGFYTCAQPCPDGGNSFGGHGVPDTVLVSVTNPECPECQDCEPGSVKTIDGELFCIQVIRPIDPNDIIGPRGYGEGRWVARMDTLEYTIRFENDPEFASAPARNVIINHTLDSNVDSVSFRLAPFGFNQFAFTIPGQRNYYTTRLDVIDSLGVMVDLSAGPLVVNNTVRWEFISVNPLTGLEFTNPLDGFLPVNDSIGSGEGFVTFTVLPKSSLQTGDSIFAEASIIFNTNDPIETNRVFNKIDATLPESSFTINNLNDSTVSISTSATDVGSGVRSYSLYAGLGQELQLVGTVAGEEDSIFTFIGTPDSTYYFVTLAEDSVGNREGQVEMKSLFPHTFNGVTGIPEVAGFKALIFPNPTGGTATLQLSKQLNSRTEAQLYIRNALGQVIDSRSIAPRGQQEVTIDLSSLRPGTYIIELQIEQQRLIQPLIKQ